MFYKVLFYKVLFYKVLFYKYLPVILPNSVTTAIEGEITVMAVTQYSNLTGNYHGPEYATDKDLSTFSLVEADGSAGGPWFKIDLSQPHLLDRVVIFLMFFNDWYYFPDNHCLLSYDSYQV